MNKKVKLKRKPKSKLTPVKSGEEKARLQQKINRPAKSKSNQKSIAKELKESKSELVSILQSLPDTIIIFDKDGKYVSIPKTRRALPLIEPEKQLIGKYLHEVLPGDKAEFLLRNIKRALVSSSPIHFEYDLIMHGRTHWLYGTMTTKDNNHVVLIVRDMTGKKLGEDRINEALSLLNATIESTADGILVVNNDGIVTGFNQRFIKMWKIPRHLINTKSAKKLLDLITDQLKEPDKFIRQVNWLYEHRGKESYDVIEFKDGRIFERFSIPQQLKKKIVGRVWNFRDVTEKYLSEEALIESEKRFRSLFETSAEGIAIMTTVFEECNAQLTTLFGCAKEDIIGRPPWDFSPEVQPDGRDSQESALEKINAALNGMPQYFYWQHMRKDKVVIDTEVSLKLFYLEGKKLVQASIRDITERKRFEKVQNALYKISEAVNTTEDIQTLYTTIHEVIKSLMPASNFYIALYDEEAELISFPYFVDEYDPQPKPRKPGRGLTEYVIRSGQDMIITGERDLELREKGDVDLVGKPSAVWVGVVLKHEGKISGVMAVQDYHNEYTYGEMEKQILIFVSEQIALAIDRKRTSDELINYTRQLQVSKDLLEERARELARLNLQLAESEKTLKELNASKDKLFSIIAHDLKSPFQPLIGISEILSEEYKSLSEVDRDNFIREMHKTIKNQYKLVENLLDWSRIQTGRMDFSPEKINLSECIDSNIDVLNANAISKSIILSNEVKNNIYVTADLSMLNSVLQNLISNAIKFSYPDNEVTIAANTKNNMVEISVEDNGVGLTEGDLEKIFRIDIQHTTTGTAQEKGTGLGLIICKELVEKNDGKIWAESKSLGTRFTFSLKKT